MGIFQRGGVWYARWWEDGRIQKKSLETRDRQEARELFDLVYAPAARPQAKRGRGGKAAAPARAPSSVRDAVEAWLRRVEVDYAGRETVNTYRAQGRRWQARWGSLPLASLTRDELQEWRDERLGQVKPRTVKHERAILLGFLKWCQREGYLDRVPAVDAIKGVPRKRSRPAAAELEEVETLLMVARDHPDAQVRALETVVMLCAFAGLRRAEAAALEWGDVDLEGAVLTVRAHGRFRPKSGEEREVPIGPRLLEHLRALRTLRPKARWVAESDTLGPWVVGSMTRWARRLWQAANLHEKGGAVLHSLRHYYATTLVRNGADVETVRELLGHSSVTVSEVYFATTLDRKRRAVEGL